MDTVLFSTVLFSLGHCAITHGAMTALEAIHVEPATLLRRHQCGDWGNLCQQDRQTNYEAVTDGFRVFSAYELTSAVRVWVITDADRSSTTILLPDEY